MIKVGIDASILSKPLTGIGRYLHYFSQHLSHYPGDFYFYSPDAIPLFPHLNQKSFHLKTGTLKNRSSQLIWSQTMLPLWAKQDNIDIFWGPAHRLPKYLPKKTKKVLTVHDLTYIHAKEAMRKDRYWLEKTLLPQAINASDLIFSDSISTAQNIVSRWPKVEHKIKILYPGTPPLPRPSANLSDLGIKKPFFLFVSTLEPRKNLERLLIAFSRLSEDIKYSYDLVIAGGSGWGNINIHSIIEKYDLKKHVHILGYINDSKLATLYDHAHFLAMPSLYEGFGFPLVESLSFNTPVLTSNISSMPELIGSAGILIDPFDVNDITEGLKKMFTPEIHHNLVNQAKIQDNPFCWKKSALNFWNDIQEII